MKLPGRDHRVVRLVGVDRDDRARPGHREVQLEVGAEGDLDDAVDVVGEALHLVDGVRLAVVDDEVGAGRARQLALLVRAHRGDDAGAGVLGQLDRVVPDRPGPARDEHGPPGEGPAVAAAADEQAVRRGHGRHAQAGAQLVRRVRRAAGGRARRAARSTRRRCRSGCRRRSGTATRARRRPGSPRPRPPRRPRRRRPGAGSGSPGGPGR